MRYSEYGARWGLGFIGLLCLTLLLMILSLIKRSISGSSFTRGLALVWIPCLDLDQIYLYHQGFFLFGCFNITGWTWARILWDCTSWLLQLFTCDILFLLLTLFFDWADLLINFVNVLVASDSHWEFWRFAKEANLCTNVRLEGRHIHSKQNFKGKLINCQIFPSHNFSTFQILVSEFLKFLVLQDKSNGDSVLMFGLGWTGGRYKRASTLLSCLFIQLSGAMSHLEPALSLLMNAWG